MAWRNEMVRIVRHLINDVDSSNYTFSDDRLEEVVLVASQLVLREIDFDNSFTVDVDASTLSPDPTELETKDDNFINLVCLKTVCVILGSEVRSNSLNAIVLRDGPSSIDLRSITSNVYLLYKDFCEKYDHYVLQFKAGSSVAGQAVLSPYAPASYNISTFNLTSRNGRFE